MKSLILVFVLGWSCMANAFASQQKSHSNEKWGLSYALDLSQSVSESSFECIRQYGYTVVFLRCYSPNGQGEVDPAVVYNIQNAYNAGLGTEVYMTPLPNSVKSAPQQFDEMYNYLTTSGIKLLTVWIQVTSPINWYTSVTSNINFLENLVARAKDYGLNVGIYTNYYDWDQITSGLVLEGTGTYMVPVQQVKVQAISMTSTLLLGGTPPIVKQFGQAEYVCGVTVNRDVYETSSLVAAADVAEFVKAKQIVVGFLGMGNTTFTKKEETRL